MVVLVIDAVTSAMLVVVARSSRAVFGDEVPMPTLPLKPVVPVTVPPLVERYGKADVRS
jgi:hypothetical protein